MILRPAARLCAPRRAASPARRLGRRATGQRSGSSAAGSGAGAGGSSAAARPRERALRPERPPRPALGLGGGRLSSAAGVSASGSGSRGSGLAAASGAGSGAGGTSGGRSRRARRAGGSSAAGCRRSLGLGRGGRLLGGRLRRSLGSAAARRLRLGRGIDGCGLLRAAGSASSDGGDSWDSLTWAQRYSPPPRRGRPGSALEGDAGPCRVVRPLLGVADDLGDVDLVGLAVDGIRPARPPRRAGAAPRRRDRCPPACGPRRRPRPRRRRCPGRRDRTPSAVRSASGAFSMFSTSWPSATSKPSDTPPPASTTACEGGVGGVVVAVDRRGGRRRLVGVAGLGGQLGLDGAVGLVVVAVRAVKGFHAGLPGTLPRRRPARGYAAWMPTASLEDVTWNLEHLVDGEGQAGVERLLDEAAEQAPAFAERHAGKVAELDGPGLAAAMDELAAISELAGRAGNYAALRFSADTSDPANGALMPEGRGARHGDRDPAAVLRARVGRASTTTRPTSCWRPTGSTTTATTCATSAATARTCSPSPRRRSSPRRTSAAAAPGARLFAELMSRDRGPPARPGRAGPDGGRRQPAHAPRPRGPRRGRARRSPRRSSPACAPAPSSSTRCCTTRPSTTACATTRPGSRAATSPTRPPTSPSRRWSRPCSGNFDIPQRWYRVKAGLLGVDKLADYDRMAPGDHRGRGVRVGRRACSSCSTPTSPSPPSSATSSASSSTSAGSTRRCAPASAAARSAPTPCPSVHPYVLLNYTSRRRDVLTLAHELGHGVHAALARPRGPFEMGTPLTLAETASVFGETIVFGRLLDAAADRRSRAWPCSPSRSRARSPPSSARSR